MLVIGGGFGGLRAVQGLRRAPVQITLIDRRNFHLFQPLTYQVATGALSPTEVAYPLRALFKSAPNVRVMMAEVSGFDLSARQVALSGVAGVAAPPTLPYDTLIVAAGSSYAYYGHASWREFAAEVKSLESALGVRSQILTAFERAEFESDPEARAAELTFVVVGGGPTGVEMAGQIGELARDLGRDFRAIDPRKARVLLVETTDRLLGTFPPSLSARTARSLERLGVTPMLGRSVVDIDADGVTLESPDGAHERVASKTVIWAAGVQGSGLAAKLGELTGAEVDRAGRVTVAPDLTLPGHPEVIVLGDMARVKTADGGVMDLPGVAPVAIQQGKYAAKLVRDRLRGRPIKPFRYLDKGNLATIGRGRAVAAIGPVKLSGWPAWMVWLVVHLWYLIGYQNRLVVMIRWSFSFLNHGRGARLITERWPPDTHQPESPG